MSRIRSIKPEFWQDRKLAMSLSRDQRLFYIGLWNEADDEGRFLAHPRRLLGAIFPYESDISEDAVSDALRLLCSIGCIRLYTVEGVPMGEVVQWSRHQHPNRPTKSRLPASTLPAAVLHDPSLSPHGVAHAKNTVGVRSKELGVRSEEVGSRSDLSPPNIPSVQDGEENDNVVSQPTCTSFMANVSKGGQSSLLPEDENPDEKAETLPWLEMKLEWNAAAKNLPGVSSIMSFQEKHKNFLRPRLLEQGGASFWTKIIAVLESDDHLSGRDIEQREEKYRNWRVNLDYLCLERGWNNIGARAVDLDKSAIKSEDPSYHIMTPEELPRVDPEKQRKSVECMAAIGEKLAAKFGQKTRDSLPSSVEK